MGSIGFLLVGMVIANPILPDITNAHFNFGESPAHYVKPGGSPDTSR